MVRYEWVRGEWVERAGVVHPPPTATPSCAHPRTNALTDHPQSTSSSSSSSSALRMHGPLLAGDGCWALERGAVLLQ